MQESASICPGDGARVRAEAERRRAHAEQERLALEEKLAQAERDALLTLNDRERVHREQLDGERQQKVDAGSTGLD